MDNSNNIIYAMSFMFIIIIFLVINQKNISKNKENFALSSDDLSTVRTEINRIYDMDVEAIRNLGHISKSLLTGTNTFTTSTTGTPGELTIPADTTTFQGAVKIGNLTINADGSIKIGNLIINADGSIITNAISAPLINVSDTLNIGTMSLKSTGVIDGGVNFSSTVDMDGLRVRGGMSAAGIYSSETISIGTGITLDPNGSINCGFISTPQINIGNTLNIGAAMSLHNTGAIDGGVNFSGTVDMYGLRVRSTLSTVGIYTSETISVGAGITLKPDGTINAGGISAVGGIYSGKTISVGAGMTLEPNGSINAGPINATLYRIGATMAINNDGSIWARSFNKLS